ncbi:unnamed protein product [Parajaminaea phylloscopi]
MAQPRSRVVFVGNIPYDMAEEQLISIFSEVGPVVGFRLVFDRDTGKPKGYGFCEFHDPETAASAVRNLNDVDVGGRSLRIDWADVDPVFQGRTTQMGQIDGELPKREGRRPGNPGGGRPGMGMGMGMPMGGGGANMGMGGGPPPPLGMAGQQQQFGGQQGGPSDGSVNYNLNNLPPGVNLQAGQNSTDAITQTLATLPPEQLLDIMGQIKTLVLSSPQSAQNLLNSHPQLTYALFQAMLMMNLVDPAILQRILAGSGNAPPTGGMPPQMQQQQQQQRFPNNGNMGGAPPPGPPPSNPGYGAPGPSYGQQATNGGGYSNTPPPGAGPPGRVPSGPYGMGMAPGAANTPPPAAPYGMPPQAPGANPQAAAPPAASPVGMASAAAASGGLNNPNLPDAQRQLLMQVLSLTDAQIAALPADQRESILMLRRQMGK